jgi:cytochrome c oxidase assembly factor CtaG
MTAADVIFADWTLPWGITLTVAAFAAIYLRGWIAIRKTRPEQFPPWRLFCFLSGLAVVWISIASPIDGFADVLLSAHMVEHLLLMSAVPPLIWSAAPVVPLLRGLPRSTVQVIVGPLIRWRTLRKLEHFFVQPVAAWLTFNLTFLLWHVPAAYNYALEHEHVHEFEHLCFLSSSLLFWYVLLEPWPARKGVMRWGLLAYLITSDLVNTALSAFLAFCDRNVYTFYEHQPNPFGVNLVADQTLGAVIMWVMGSMFFLVPAVMLTVRLLQPKRAPRIAHQAI